MRKFCRGSFSFSSTTPLRQGSRGENSGGDEDAIQACPPDSLWFDLKCLRARQMTNFVTPLQGMPPGKTHTHGVARGWFVSPRWG